jgi:hypothetical protein
LSIETLGGGGDAAAAFSYLPEYLVIQARQRQSRLAGLSADSDENMGCI